MSDATGKIQVSLVSNDNPFDQSDLLSEECFILDHGKNKIIFVWKGEAIKPGMSKPAPGDPLILNSHCAFFKVVGSPLFSH